MITFMMKSDHMLKLWEAMEEEKSIGLVRRLYSSDVPFNIYGTFQYPEMYYGIAFNFSNDIRIDISSFSKLRDLKVILLKDNTFIHSHLLIVELLDSGNRNIFATLCENLIQSVIKNNKEQVVASSVINQLEKWKTLFERIGPTGLSHSEQQGLFGELHFLQKCLNEPSNKPFNVLNNWIGVNKELHDFQRGSWALEVKTTSTNNPQKVTINGERQLDETLLENLYLYHLSLAISTGIGQNLCQKIETIRKSLINDMPALSLFNIKLFEAGYFDKHEPLYQERFYQIRNESFYKIENGFPRIKENELRRGLSDVSYSIILAMCDKYLVPENQIFKTINCYDRN